MSRFLVDRLVTPRVITQEILLPWVTRELVPVLQKLRAAHNDLASFISSSTDTELTVDLPTGVALTVKYNGTTRFKVDSTGVAFFGAAPVARQADPGALMDSTGGTAGPTISDVGAAFNQATLNNNFASLTEKVNDIRNVLNLFGFYG